MKATTLAINAPDPSGVMLFGTGGTLDIAPTATAISPTTGSTLGGTAVTIGGTGFIVGATVTIGGVDAGSVVVVNATTITASTGAHAAGTVDVVVTNPDAQTGTLTNGFTFVTPPSVTSIAPTSGATTGGTAVTITGTNFVAGATVTIGGVAATSVNVVNATTITATTGAHAAGPANVTVTNPNTLSGTLVSGFTFNVPSPAPTITSTGPASGPTFGGTPVTIRGTNFASPATVAIGGGRRRTSWL